jgi:hypothetical protein
VSLEEIISSLDSFCEVSGVSSNSFSQTAHLFLGPFQMPTSKASFLHIQFHFGRRRICQKDIIVTTALLFSPGVVRGAQGGDAPPPPTLSHSTTA